MEERRTYKVAWGYHSYSQSTHLDGRRWDTWDRVQSGRQHTGIGLLTSQSISSAMHVQFTLPQRNMCSLMVNISLSTFHLKPTQDILKGCDDFLHWKNSFDDVVDIPITFIQSLRWSIIHPWSRRSKIRRNVHVSLVLSSGSGSLQVK